MKTTFIYALLDPRTLKVEYVGRADNPKRRLVGHVSDSYREKTPKALWIGELLLLGLRPTLEIVDQVPLSEWKFWEREYVRVFRILGNLLLNANDGGGGPTHHSEESKKKISAGGKGKGKSPEACRKNSESQRGEKNHRFGKPATRGFSGKHHTAYSKAKLRQTTLRREKDLAEAWEYLLSR